jgi:hypothetical protein
MNKNDVMALNQFNRPDEKPQLGSINDKYPIVLKDGRTVIRLG